MRAAFILIISLVAGLLVKGQGQGFVPPGASAHYVFLQHKQINGIMDSRYGVPTDKSYLIDGTEVTGTPFLYDDWLSGSVLTADGRKVENLQLRYDAYAQKLHYQQGDQSIIVEEPLSEFRLNSAKKESSGYLLFRKGTVFGNKRDDNFYEVLKESPAGNCLVKLNKKSLFTDASAVLSAHRKYLDLQVSYFYYNAKTGKLKKIKNDGSNLPDVSGAPAKALNMLGATHPDLGTESGLKEAFDILNGNY